MSRKAFPRHGRKSGEFVRMVAATITSLVPQGMVLTATVSFTLGAVYMSRRGAVVQRLNAVEAMASIDVICTDKTGTLTTNRLHLEKLHIIDTGLGEEAVRQRLHVFAWASVDEKNKNILALRQALGEEFGRSPSPGAVEVVDQIPFKSQQRYSAVRVVDHGTGGPWCWERLKRCRNASRSTASRSWRKSSMTCSARDCGHYSLAKSTRRIGRP